MRKIFKKIHLWLSVPVGVFVVIICITGALMVFEKVTMFAIGTPTFRKKEATRV